ncbi:hypothetical protein B0H13DRAFT_1897649 [Mycena leptocephala]|nr:hypothetical protein B0H13DRAFT_1897649 [Mycena leptocephala]
MGWASIERGCELYPGFRARAGLVRVLNGFGSNFRLRQSSDQLFLIDKQRNKASLPELSLSDFMDLIGAHPQLAPEVVQVLSNALKTAERRVHELEQELAEQKAFSSSSTAGGIPPCSSQCCPDKIQKISQIESDLARLQSLENSEIQKLSEEKSTLELALETTRQQCDEQQRKNTDITEEYERERKMGSELRTLQALEERYLAIRTVESDLKERRRTSDRDLETLTRQKEEWGLKQAEHERAIEEIREGSAAAITSLQEKHSVTLAALASKNSGLVRTLQSTQAECTTLEQKFQALSAHAAASQSSFKEALRVSNGKVIAKQADLDKLQQQLDTLGSQSGAKIRSLEQELQISTTNLSTSRHARALMTRSMLEDSTKIRELQQNLDGSIDRQKKLASTLNEKLETASSQLRAAREARDQLAQDLECSQANERRLTERLTYRAGLTDSSSSGALDLASPVPLRKAPSVNHVRSCTLFSTHDPSTGALGATSYARDSTLHADSDHPAGDGGVGETGLPATYQHPRTLFEPSTIQYLVTDREHRPTAADPVP